MILVTGAAGHVGRAVVSRLASHGHDVVAMVPDVQAASRRLPSGIALRVADYKDASALKRALAGIDDMVLISLPLRAENQRAFEISFVEQRPGVRIA